MYHGALKDEALKIHEEALREYNDQCEKNGTCLYCFVQ